VHLAAESIGNGRWTSRRKERIRNSRVLGTRLLAETLAKLDPTPSALVSASATGYYGDRGDETLTEDSASGRGFLPEVAIEWEAAADPAVRAGIRVVHLRFGIILSPAGGTLPRMHAVFRKGLGARLGTGRQYWPWIDVEDVAAVVQFALSSPVLRGPVNAVAPEPVTNARFTASLARAAERPILMPLPVPAFAIKLLFGQMGTEVLLSGARVVPDRLQSAGYEFRQPDLDAALARALAAG